MNRFAFYIAVTASLCLSVIALDRSSLPNKLEFDADRYAFDDKGNFIGKGNVVITGDGVSVVADKIKLNPKTGELIWVGQLRETSAYNGLGVGVDEDGNVFIAGEPGYIATFDRDGGFVQFHRFVGSFPSLMDIAVYSLGNAYLCGWDGGYTGYVVKYDRNGVRMWEREYRLNGWSCPKSIAAFTDGSNDIISGGCQGGPGRRGTPRGRAR